MDQQQIDNEREAHATEVLELKLKVAESVQALKQAWSAVFAAQVALKQAETVLTEQIKVMA